MSLKGRRRRRKVICWEEREILQNCANACCSGWIVRMCIQNFTCTPSPGSTISDLVHDAASIQYSWWNDLLQLHESSLLLYKRKCTFYCQQYHSLLCAGLYINKTEVACQRLWFPAFNQPLPLEQFDRQTFTGDNVQVLAFVCWFVQNKKLLKAWKQHKTLIFWSVGIGYWNGCKGQTRFKAKFDLLWSVCH